MFYCLGKATKVHSKNILSPQRGLAIDSYRNIVKAIRICQFYKQNNIMKELAQKTFSSLENILKKYQDKFSHEEIFGVTPSGQIVNPDGLSLILSSFGLNARNPSPNPSIGLIMDSSSHIKMNPTMTNQIYSNTNNNAKPVNSMKSVQPIMTLQTSSPNDDIPLQKRNQIQQSSSSSFNFIHQGSHEESQQFVTSSETLFADPFVIPTNSLAQNDITTTSTSEPFWMDLSSPQSTNLHSNMNSNLVDDDNSPFDHITTANSIGTSSDDQPVSSSTNYFSPQPRRTQSLPMSTSSPTNHYTSETIKSHSISSHPRSNQMSLDFIDQEIQTSPNNSPILQQRYVSMNINDINDDSFSSENNNNFVMSEEGESSSMHDDDNSRMPSYNNSSTTTNETTYRGVFNKLPTTTTSRRINSPSSSSGLKKKEAQNGAFTEIQVLSKRLGFCGATTIPNVNTSIGIGYDGIENDYDQFESNSVAMSIDIGGFKDFENSGI